MFKSYYASKGCLMTREIFHLLSSLGDHRKLQPSKKIKKEQILLQRQDTTCRLRQLNFRKCPKILANAGK